MKIKKGDNVLVIKGKDRRKTGKVLRVFPSLNKVVIEGINIMIKHTRPKTQDKKGEKIRVPAPMSISNIKLICPNCSSATKVAYELAGDKKVRICKKCQKAIN